ncbi:hypothetical protein [Gordonia sihwensis]|uniref:hypothetical protein n=1 Tax=Gordonia sihwensis TaxID=173559 RepID=UPI0005EE68C2|nr:hypothetical protein [Gordonia sihwensis]KJR10465.1 hypothetical protein UG54_00230 [Gordonia sihwensis]
MAKTVLAVDVGSATITAACAGADVSDPTILSPHNQEWWPAAVYVGADGTLLSDDVDHPTAETVITRFTRLLGREAQVIAGSARHADSLVAAALTPALTAATTHLRHNIDLVIATYPSTWPTQIVEAYRFAISQFAPADSTLVPWSDAVAASTLPPKPYVDCPITSIDIGARSSTVTMVRVSQSGHARTEYSITNPQGGWAQIVRPIIARIADQTGTEIPRLTSETWWDQAISAFSRARQDPTGQRPNADPDTMIIEFPAPLGALTVDYDDITELICLQMTDPQSELMADVGFPAPPEGQGASLLSQLLDRGPVTGRWTVPGNPHASRPIIELTGGLAEEPGVQRAVRQKAETSVMVADTPVHAAAWGAALIGVQSHSKLIGGRR